MDIRYYGLMPTSIQLPIFLRCYQSWQGKYGNARNYRIISPLGLEKFLLAGTDCKKFFLIGNKAPGTCRIRLALTLRREKVSVTRFARKSHQRRSRNKNNSVTDTKRRMPDSPIFW